MSITSLKSGWKTIEKTPGDARAELKKVFITNNPNPADQREKLVKPEAPSGFYYSNHETTQSEVARDLENTAFSDLLIADLDGTRPLFLQEERRLRRKPEDRRLEVDRRRHGLRQGDRQHHQGDRRFRARRPSPACASMQASGRSAIFYAVPIVKLGAAEGRHALQGA